MAPSRDPHCRGFELHEWLRRQRRRADAHRQLQTAHENSSTSGWRRPPNEHARKRTAETKDDLTRTLV